MSKSQDGFWSCRVSGISAGARYRFRVGDIEFPDPASRQQDTDSGGWSILRQPFPRSTDRSALRPWHETIICEVHIGTATPEGTFDGLRKRLGHFRDAGYTCLEIMPVHTFPGERNWGYDSTLLFAPHPAYGTPEDLRALVARAHELGLCLILDVVYNHFGPLDNFLPRYAPEWFDPKVETPWGPGIDFSQKMVRRFYYENAMMWLAEYDFDGLRFDSVHEIKSEASDHFLMELAELARKATPHAHLVIENMENSASWLDRDAASNEPRHFTAQWNDDFHHVLHHLITGERGPTGYDGTKDPYADLEKALADGFVHDGEADGESDGRSRDEPGSRLPPDAFVGYLQNHDQIGNRGDARRLTELVDAERLDFVHFITMLSPHIPLFFMGEEAALTTPFPFFIDFPEADAEEKRQERYEQMKEMFKRPIPSGGLPDPNERATFLRAKLEWDNPSDAPALEKFRRLAKWRRDMVWPLLATDCQDAVSARQGDCILVTWIFDAGTLSMALNPTAKPCQINAAVDGMPVATGTFHHSGETLSLGAWSAIVWRAK